MRSRLLLIPALGAIFALSGCSTKDKDVQIVASSSDGVSAVNAATHDRVAGKSRLIEEVKVYVQVNKKIGFDWSNSADDAARRTILGQICSAPGIESVLNRDGANLCVPR